MAYLKFVLQIFHKNVAHPKLDAFIKKHRWIVESEEFLIFPQNQSEYKGGVFHYIESIEEVYLLIWFRASEYVQCHLLFKNG